MRKSNRITLLCEYIQEITWTLKTYLTSLNGTASCVLVCSAAGCISLTFYSLD